MRKFVLSLIYASCVWAADGNSNSGIPAPAPQAPAVTPLLDETLASALHEKLPEWLTLSGEFRTRVEGRTAFGFIPGNNNAYGLFRTRFNIDLSPTYWFEVYAQMQDAHEIGQMRSIAPRIYQDPLDLRQAYVKFKSKSGLIKFTVGRQLLSYGGQLLIGPLDWTNVARTWDAAKMELGTENIKVDLFASSVVVSNPNAAIDHSRTGNDIHGAYGSLKKVVPFTTLEPYLFWRVGHESLYTAGLRLAKMPGSPGLSHLDYQLEGDKQWGTIGVRTASAYAFTGVVGKTFTSGAWAPRLSGEYDAASGNRNPADATHTGTFDQLLGTNHGLYGILDQVGLRNMRQYRLGGDVKPRKFLTTALDYRWLYLMTPKDNLYDATGAISIKPKAGNSANKIGDEIDLSGTWQVSKQLRLSGGVGHLMSGSFIKLNSKASNMTFPYVALQYAF